MIGAVGSGAVGVRFHGNFLRRTQTLLFYR